MASALTHQDRVLYSCSCSQLSTLGELFFCRHCKLPRCQDCVSSTVESFSCPHCFEAAMTDALKSKKGRCSRCFQCPQCFTTLTTRSVIVPGEISGEQSSQKGDKPQPKSSTGKSPGGTKLYYLSCSYCKWSTRDVGIKDKRSPIDFKDRPSSNQARFDALVSFYKDYAASDNALREKTKKSITGRRSQRSYSSLLDPTKFTKGVSGGESPQMFRRGSAQLSWNPAMIDKIMIAASDPKPPPDHLYSEEVDLELIPTLEQQLKDPVFQPQHTKDLAPSQLRLTGKKLHRCKGCEHILMKAELNLNSIRFKILQAAIHFIPQVRIVELRFRSGADTQMLEAILSVNNPLNYGVNISFAQVSADEVQRVKEVLADVSFPEGEFFLGPNDDVLDFLEGEGGESDIKDDPQYVEKRLPGKLFLKFAVAPPTEEKDEAGKGGPGGKAGGSGKSGKGGGRRVLKMMFRMSFTYKSTVEANQENDTCTVGVPVLVRLLKPKSA